MYSVDNAYMYETHIFVKSVDSCQCLLSLVVLLICSDLIVFLFSCFQQLIDDDDDDDEYCV